MGGNNLALFQNRSTTALQIKDHVIRYVTAKKPSISTVKSFGEILLPKGTIEKGKIIDEEVFHQVLETCVRKWKLKNKKVKFFVPDATLFFRKLTIPSDIVDEEVRGYLNFEIGTSIHLPFEEAYFDFHFLPGETEEGRDILFFATPEPLMLDYRKKLEKHKLRPVSGEVSPLSAYSLFTNLNMTNNEDHYLLIEWDISSINLSIFHEHLPIFIRYIPNTTDSDDWKEDIVDGMYTLVPVNKEKIQMEMLDQLSEIERVMNFYRYSLRQGESQITKILLVGDHPMLTDIENQLIQYEIPLMSLGEKELGYHFTKLGLHRRYLLPLSLCLKEV